MLSGFAPEVDPPTLFSCPPSLPGWAQLRGLEPAGSAVCSKACGGGGSQTSCCAFLCGCQAHLVMWPQVGGREPWDRAEAVQVCFGFSGAELEDIQILC